MLKFKQHLSEAAAKNLHLVHIEDLVLDGGVKGARQALSLIHISEPTRRS